MKQLRKIIAASIIAVSTLFLSGCSNLNYIRFPFLNKETKKSIRNLQKITTTIEKGTPDYYAEKYQHHPQNLEYQERIYSLSPENWPRTKAEIEKLDKE